MADIEEISNNISELLTNTVNMSSIFYDLFISNVPMDVELKQYNDKNELVTISIPNRAKDMSKAIIGSGTPEEFVPAPMGTLYIDGDSLTVYVKVRNNEEATGWSVIFTQEGAEEYIRSYLRDNNYVTEIDVRGYLINNEYATKNDVKEELSKFKPILSMSPLPSSGEITLTDNEGYYIRPEGNVQIVLPSISDLTKLHSILVQVYISDSFINGNYSFDFGTPIYFDELPPDFSISGSYNLIYEYDFLTNVWVCGHITKGVY